MAEMCEEDRMELIITRTVSPRLTSLESAIKVFTTQQQYILNAFAEQKQENKTNHKDIIDDIERINRKLLGNGTEGLIVEVSLHKKWIETQIWFQRLLLGVLVAEAIALFMALLATP